MKNEDFAIYQNFVVICDQGIEPEAVANDPTPEPAPTVGIMCYMCHKQFEPNSEHETLCSECRKFVDNVHAN